MPSPTDFKRAFGFDKLDNTKKVSVGHVVEKQNEVYSFPITILFNKDDGVDDKDFADAHSLIKDTLESMTVGQLLVIYSAFGSPYDCTVGQWSVVRTDDFDKATAEGKAIRNREKLNLRQQSDLKREQSGEVDIFKLLSKEEKKPFKFRKSAYSTSKCAKCHEGIAVGDRICKKKTETGRGGWVHITCEPAFEGKQHATASPAKKARKKKG